MAPREMRLRELWSRLAADIEVGSPVTAGEQRFLLAEPCVRRALEASTPAEREQGYQACRATLLRFRDARRLDGGSFAQRSETSRKAHLLGGDGTERWYAKQLSERIARLAGADQGLVASREEMWGTSKPLTRPLAQALLNSPILRFMTKAELDAHGIPMSGHTATMTLVGPSKDRWCEVDVKVQWPKGEHSERRRIREVHFHWEQPGGQLRIMKSFEPVGIPFLEWEYQGLRQAVPVEAGSVLDAVRIWADEFSFFAPYGAWRLTRTGREPSAVTFLLTGAVPNIPAIDVGWELPGAGADSITVTAIAGTSAASVAAAFQRACRRQHKGPAPPPRRVAVALLAQEEIAKAGGTPRGFWVRLCEQWNREAPRVWHYAGWRNMRRDYLAWKKRSDAGG